MSPQSRSLPLRLFHYFWRQWCDDLTPAGRIVFWGICVTGLGTIELQMPIYQLFFGLVALISVGATAGALYRPRLMIETDFPERAAAGQPVVAHVGLRNLRRIPAYDVGANILGLPETFETNLDENLVPRLGPGERVTVPVVLVPKRRGRYELPRLRAYSSFPFALGRSGKIAKAVPPLLVTPVFEPLAALKLPTSHRYHPGGITLTSHVGESPEYIGNREYIPGEPVRRLDFRAWARVGKPVVREYQEEFHSRVALVLDTFIPGRRGGSSEEHPGLEAAVSLTAAIANTLSKGEYAIDSLAIGAEWHSFGARPLGGRFEEILGLLADVDVADEDPLGTMSPRLHGRMRGLASAIVILLGWDRTRREMLEEIARQGCGVKTILVVPDRERSRIPVTEIPACTVLEPSDIQRGGLSIH